MAQSRTTLGHHLTIQGCGSRSLLNPMSLVSYTLTVNGLHLYSAIIQSAVQFMPLIHPFIHTPTPIGCHARYQPTRQEQLRVRCLAQGHLDMPYSPESRLFNWFEYLLNYSCRLAHNVYAIKGVIFVV